MKYLLGYCFVILSFSELTAQGPIFELDTAYNTGAVPLFVKSADFDVDGFPDLAVINYGSANVHFFFNNGDGTFSPTRFYDSRGTPVGLDIGDVNGDGFEDVAIAGGTLAVLLNNGNGTFRGAESIFEYGADGVVIGQLDNNDGEDIVAILDNNGVFVHWNLDLPYSSNYTVHGGRRWPISLSTADLDNDGFNDIAVSNWEQPQYFYTILWNQGDHAFTVNPAPLDVGGGGAIPIISGDLNRDGLSDLAVARSFPFSNDNVMSVLINQGGREFEQPLDYFFEGGITDAIMGDFDGADGIDIAAVNWGYEPYVSFLLNQGDGTLADRVDIPIGNPGYGMTTADFDCDKDLDIAVVWPYENQVAIFTNNTASEIPSILPAIIFAPMAHPIQPTPGVLAIKNFTNGHRAADVDTSSIRINGVIIPSTFTLHYPELYPCDQFIRAEFPLRDFILGYGILWDSTVRAYNVSGQYQDGTVFSVEGEVTMIGHRSGDLNRDGQVGIQDLTYQVDYIFRGGPSPVPLEAGDIDGSCGSVNISDLTYLVNFMFRSGPLPTHECIE